MVQLPARKLKEEIPKTCEGYGSHPSVVTSHGVFD